MNIDFFSVNIRGDLFTAKMLTSVIHSYSELGRHQQFPKRTRSRMDLSNHVRFL